MARLTPRFRLHAVDTGDDLAFEPKRLIVAGYPGRDSEAVREHIAELFYADIEEFLAGYTAESTR
jgi:hypothetical protein